MKAIVNRQYGSPDVLKIENLPVPDPAEDEVLVKIHAASVNAYDWHLLRADPFIVRFAMGMQRPKHIILGADISGTVEAVGEEVSEFKPGDAVFGDLSENRNGGFAEYTTCKAAALAAKPEGISFEEAAGLPMAGMTALQGLRNFCKVKPGQKVLIQGSAGGVGTFAVQLARYFEAEVVAVCSERNREQSLTLGADEVIDYKKEDITRSGRQFDVILAVNGYHSLRDYSRILKPGGIYAMAGGSNRQIFQALLQGWAMTAFSGKKFTLVESKPNRKDLEFLANLVLEGKLKPVIDRTYPLAETAEAIRYLEMGHARGKVVIRVVE